MKSISKYISQMAPCIELLAIEKKKRYHFIWWPMYDFGANVKFLLGTKKKYRKIKIENLKTQISNKKLNQIVNGNTNTVYKNPLNSLRFVLNKIKKDKINLNKDFWVFTGSSVGVVPILGKGIYTGKIEKLGSVKALIR